MDKLQLKADELVERHRLATPLFSGYACVKHAIVSTKNTIEVLEQLDKITQIDMCGEILHETNISDALDEQLELKKILEGRL